MSRAAWLITAAVVVAPLVLFFLWAVCVRLWDALSPRRREAAAAEAAREARRLRPCDTMNRATLVEHLAEFSAYEPGRSIMAGMDTAALRELCAEVQDGRGWSGYLPGERGGWSVYRVRFEDGAAYVGMTGGTVVDRIGRHLGGAGSPAVRQRYRAGVGYRFAVLASGLTEREARRIELDEIGRLDQPLNVLGARDHGGDLFDLFDETTWRGPGNGGKTTDNNDGS